MMMQVMEQRHEAQVKERTGSWAKPNKQAERWGNLGGLQEKVMILHAKGLCAWEIGGVLLSCEGLIISEEMIENMLEWVMPGFTAWESRPLAPHYERVCIIELRVVVKQDKRQTSKRAVASLGIVPEGYGDVLGLWLTETPCEMFWKSLFSGLSIRGIQRISKVTCFESKEIVLALDSVFPGAAIQHSTLYSQDSHSRPMKSKDKKSICQGAWMAGDTQNPSGNVAHGFYMSLCKAARGDTPFPGDEAVLKALFWRAMGWKASVTSFSDVIESARCNPFAL